MDENPVGFTIDDPQYNWGKVKTANHNPAEG